MSNRNYNRRSNQNYRDANIGVGDGSIAGNGVMYQENPQLVAAQGFPQQQGYNQQQTMSYQQVNQFGVSQQQPVYNNTAPFQQTQQHVYVAQPQYQYNPPQQQRGGAGRGNGRGGAVKQQKDAGTSFPRPGGRGVGYGQQNNNNASPVQSQQTIGYATFVPGQRFSPTPGATTAAAPSIPSTSVTNGNGGFTIPQPMSQQQRPQAGQWNQPLNHQQLPQNRGRGFPGDRGRGGGFPAESHRGGFSSDRGGARGGGGGAGGGGDRSGAEFKTKFDRIIRAFLENDDLNDITLPSTLTPKERHDVHKLAMHYRLDHASSGPKDARTLKLTKATGIRATECQTTEGENAVLVKTMDGYQGLQPLHDEHLEGVGVSVKESIHELHNNMVFALEHIDDNSILARKPRQFAEDRAFRGPPPSQDQFKMSRGDHAALVDFRKTLPSYKSKNEIVDAVRNNDVIIVSGDTGCGKTTQIPQILDDAGIFPKNSCIICTQPRRISALSVAERVAQERGEPCGSSVGYVIRFENVTSSATRIAFVTTGILLRRMHADPSLPGVSCVIVDEVHERDLDTDFALLLLRDIIRGGNPSKLKLVIMSATIQIDRLVDYFTFKGRKVPPKVTIPGTLFPVSVYYLEHALRWLKLPNEAASAMNLLDIATTAADANLPNADDSAQLSSSSSAPVKNNADEFKKLETAAVNQLTREDEVTVPYDVVVGLIEMFHTMTHGAMDQSILVFLPGWGQIDRVASLLKRSKHARELSIHMLHSSIPSSQQARVFNPAPRNFRKVVLSTNIAETSITINDVVFVIDSCVLKGSAYDAAGNTSTLASQMIAKANGKQRRGRAGRVRSGVCVHLLPQTVYEGLPDFLPAEIMRSSLEEVCLQVKSLRKDELCVDVLERALDTPPLTSVTHAVKLLKDLSAFDSKENITNLGKALAGLPLHPLLGKMLLVASLLGVLKPIATIAGALGGKSPFTRPLPTQRFEADEVKRSLSGIHASDHIALLNLYNEWESSPYGFQYAREHFADHAVLRGMQRSTKQFTRLVCQSGFLRKLSKAINDGSKGTRKGGDSHMQEIAEMFASRHEDNFGLIRFALLWSLYPRVGCAERRKANPDLFCWDNKSCSIHNSSVLFKSKRFAFENREFFVYFERMRLESNLNIMDVTLVPRVMALLCAKEISLHPLEDIPEAFYKDAGSKYDAMEPMEADIRERKGEMSVLRMDGGKKLFYLPNRPAELIRDLREVMEFYFSLSIKEVDASIFPEALVKALGEVIHYPVQDVDVAKLVEEQRKRDEAIRKQIALGGPDAADLEDLLAGGGMGANKSGVAVNWEGLEDDDDDELGVPVVVEDAGRDILTGNLSEAKANKIISLYGDLAILHRAKVTFTAGSGALGINNGVSEALPVEEEDTKTNIEAIATTATKEAPISNNNATTEGAHPSSTTTTMADHPPSSPVVETPIAGTTTTTTAAVTENPMASLDPYYIEEDTDVAWN